MIQRFFFFFKIMKLLGCLGLCPLFFPFFSVGAMMIPEEVETIQSVDSHSLPRELWTKILDYLPEEDRANFSLVSQGFYHYLWPKGRSVTFSHLKDLNKFIEKSKSSLSFYTLMTQSLRSLFLPTPPSSHTRAPRIFIATLYIPNPFISGEEIRDSLKNFLQSNKNLKSLRLKIESSHESVLLKELSKLNKGGRKERGINSQEDKGKEKNRMKEDILPLLLELPLEELHMAGRGTNKNFIKAFIDKETEKGAKRSLQTIRFEFGETLPQNKKNSFFLSDHLGDSLEKLNQWETLETFSLKNYSFLETELTKDLERITNFDCHKELPKLGNRPNTYEGTLIFTRRKEKI